MLKNLAQLLANAEKKCYAVPAFNAHNLEILQAIIAAAEHSRSPLILQASEKTLSYAGFNYFSQLMLYAAENAEVPVAVHLDHGESLEIARDCLEAGFSSIMLDGSALSFEKNIQLTKTVAAKAHKKGASCEGELGSLAGTDETKSRNETDLFTDPELAREFVERTGVDALAIAIGTHHGAHKFTHSPKLDFKRLSAIRKATRNQVPLVLHGASAVPRELVAQANRFGARIEHASGVPDAMLREAVRLGIRKVNADTDLRLAWTAAARKTIAQKPEEWDPRKILAPARELMQKTAEHRIRVLGSAGKA